MYSITKDDKYVYVEIHVAQRKTVQERKKRFYWIDGLNEARKTYPELNIKNRPDHTTVVSNYDFENSTTTWKYQIIEEENHSSNKQYDNIKFGKRNRKNKNKYEDTSKVLDNEQEALEELIEMTEEFGGCKKELPKDLTEPEKSATVEETEQSDQPAIVQEPTE